MIEKTPFHLFAVALATGMTFCGGNSAWAARVECPLARADRTISNTLPPEWRRVPYAQTLTRTRITESGVLQTLICEYGQAGAIEREAPAETRCTARTGGFDCLGPIVVAAPPSVAPPSSDKLTYRSATITVRLTSAVAASVDFDATGGVPGSYGADISFSIYSDGNIRMAPRNGAALWNHGGAAPLGGTGCESEVGAKRSRYDSTFDPFAPPLGHYACYITSDRRVGEFQMVARGTTPAGDPTLTIRFTTWPSR